MQGRVGKLKEIIAKNKEKTIAIFVAMLAIFCIGMLTMFQNTKNGQNSMDPELSKAMTYAEVQKGEEAVEGTENVQFDAFFLRDIDNDGYAESIRGTSREIGKEDTLYMEINVQTAGYLKDGKITVNGKNFYLQTSLPKDQELQNNYIGNNIKEIKFNQLNNGTQKLLTGIVRSGDYSYSSSKASAIGNNINNYSQINDVTFTGTYVDEDGQETQITKVVNFNIDWYGTTKANIYSTSQTRNIENAINEEMGTISLDFTVNTEETNQVLILKNNHVEGEIPELNGYAPMEVVYTGNNANFQYDEATRTFRLDRNATVGEDGAVTSSLGKSNSYGIRVVYPLEAYQTLGTESIQIKVPVKTYYEGYNNPGKEFKNPYQSNVPQATIVVTYQKPAPPVEHIYQTSFEIKVGKYVYQPYSRYVVSKQKPLRIYNGESEKETGDTYTVMWKGFVGTNAKLDGMVMKETKNEQPQVTDEFIKSDNTSESMDALLSNVGIYFTGVDTLLGTEGWIKVYDEDTGNLLQTFTQDNWNNYTASNPYKYKIPVKHIRVETSQIKKTETALYVYNLKEIDDEKLTTNYTLEQFETLQYIKSTLVGYLAGEYMTTTTHQANYEVPMSVASISISKNTISTQGTEHNEKITIQTETSSANNQIEWLNGTFLVKLPNEIIDAKINAVTINNKSVNLESYEVIEQNGERFLKVATRNTVPQTYTITIDVDLSPDPRIATTTSQLELYATNENGSYYYYKAQDKYDVNNNLNTTEQVNFRTTNLSLVSPNSLLTNQTATDFDDKQSVVIAPQVADLKPTYAVVDQEKEEQTAQIAVQIKNNYASTITEIKLLGKIPFEGNTYVISGNSLGSTFTTKMVNTGIVLPDELREIAKVYYSESETPDRDLSKEENGWKLAEKVENWDTIKTFLVDLGDYVMPTGKEFLFNYSVKIPNGLEFNKVAYSHHGVYFSLNTENGKYRTQTEPNKLGFRIAEKYDLTLEKYQTGKEKLVSGATYGIKEIITTNDGTEEEGESKTGVTNAEGKLTITNLYAEKVYEIKEIKTPDDYELNADVIRFVGHVDEQGVLTIEKLQGNTREEITVSKKEDENYKSSAKVEDEAKVSLKITKKEQGTENKLQYVKYKITGANLPEKGKTITTNVNGETTLKGLSVNQEYTLQEVKAEGYYLASPIKFKIVNNEGNYVVQEITENTTIVAQETTEVDSIPTIHITLEDEKIPTYDLEITKIKKVTQSTASEDKLIAKAETAFAGTEVTYLEGAKFKLYKGTEEIGEYVTDATGKLTIVGLYQYETEKDIDQTYTVKEVFAPEGYAKVKDITFKVQSTDGSLKFEAQDETQRNYEVEGNTIKLTIEDSPSFRLIKKDKETQEPIANVKFAIYNVENGEKPATNSKGEILGTKETINGKDYYTVTTNENGELTADLTEGLYKAVEIQAPEQYNIEGSTKYFGVGASREGKTVQSAQWAKSIGGSREDQVTSVVETSDGGLVVGGYFNSSTIDLGNGVTLNNKGSSDGMLIKYNAEGECEWAKGIGGYSNDVISSVIETKDGGLVIVGYFSSSTIDLGNGIILSNNGNWDGMLIKYSETGECEWAKRIGGSGEDRATSVVETSDEGLVVAGYFGSSTINLENGVTLTNKGNYDGMLIKYSAEGKCEWARGIGGNSEEQINCVIETSDGGYAVGGYFKSSEIDLGNGVTLNNKGSSDGMLIKYNAEGECEWAKGIGGSDSDQIKSVIETKEGEIIVGGRFWSNRIDLENGVILNHKGSSGISNIMLIKCNVEGECEWAKGIEESDVNEVIETRDGGLIVGGFFKSSGIDLGNGITLNNKSSSTDYRDGMLIRYNAKGECEWAKGIGGYGEDFINTVIETRDGKIIAGGYFGSSTINLGSEVTLKSNGNTDGMLIKYEEKEVPEVVTKQAKGIGGSDYEQITSVIETRDGGLVIGGCFSSKEIDLGNGIILSNNGNRDGMLIKYNAEGECEWAKGIGGNNSDEITSVVETGDEGLVVAGYFKSSEIDLGNAVTLNNKGSSDGMLIKYNAEGECEWAKGIGGNNSDEITSVVETGDGGLVVGGYFYSSAIDLGNGVTLTGKVTCAGMIIKYGASGKCEWAKTVGGGNPAQITSVIETRDGGVVAVGYFYSSTIDLGNGVTLTSRSDDGMIIKYSEEGKCEWAKGVGGSDYERITSVIETRDGGLVVVGYFSSSTIDLGNGIILINNGNRDGMLIKYSETGECEWAEVVGGRGNTYINTAIETADEGLLVAGDFNAKMLVIGDFVLNKNDEVSSETSTVDAMLIKYSKEGKVEWAKGIGAVGVSTSESINYLVENSNGELIVGGYFGGTIELENGVTLSNQGQRDGMILKLKAEMGVPEVQEVTIENTRKEFKITTDVKEIDNTKGGTISGEDKPSYEKVKYGDNSTKEIIMTPDENYEITEITVNGELYQFTANEDGTYTMPQFENMTEDKHITVSYVLKDNKITLNKIDQKTKKPLEGATFKLDQLEERTNPENVIGELTDNGQEYAIANKENEITDVLGELTNNGIYYFVKQEDGTYVPTNSKTYQVANVEGATAGIQNVTANSYIPVDLTNKEGQYVVVVNAEVSSESADKGYATITERTTAPSYSSTTGQIMQIYGTVAKKDYTSTVLQGGKTYYLHLGYRKDGSVDTGKDQIVFNSIKVYGATSEKYNFIENEGKYESTNQTKDNTVANSYIPIDLTGYTGKYNLVVNAQVSSQASNDYGYATITQNTTRPAYNSTTGRFIYISGTQEAKDYTTVLQGGQKYYLHLGYYKNASTSTGDDKFTVNSIQLTLNDSELYHTQVTTNSEGQAITQIPFGKYQITEITAPDGYELNETPIEIEFRADQNHEFTIENSEKAKVLVHHYKAVQNEDGTYTYTTEKLAQDEQLEGKINDKYTTSPKLDIPKYELIKDTEENYILPENATGTYVSGTTEVIYYYIEKDIPLTVHHYIEGTTLPVPLKDGTNAQDETGKGKEGENYTTNAMNDEKLMMNYELVEIPINAEGVYEGDEIIVTYYYKLKTPVFENSEITKTSATEKITDPVQEVFYTINYRTKIEQYLGKAKMTIVDYLPYGIDETKSELAGGKYDSKTKTITWQEEMEVFDETTSQIDITKQIKVVYQDLDVTEETIQNTVTGTIQLETPKAEDTVKATVEIPAEYVTEITVNKVWNDNEIQAQRRPESIVVQVKNGNTLVAEKEITAENAIEGKENQWTASFENLPKYNETGEKISYRVDETVLPGEEHKNDLKFYTKEQTGVVDNQATIRNTFIKPEDKTQVTVTKTWDDNNNENSKRPENIILQVKNGEQIVQTYKLDTNTETEHTFVDLEKYNEDGEEIIYTVDEQSVEKDDLKFYEKTINGHEITNTFRVPDEKIDLIVEKVWNDNKIQAQRRPENIVLRVKDGAEIVQNYVLNTEKEISHTFTNLRKYDAKGNEIKYTVEEAEEKEGDLKFYTTQIGTMINEEVEGEITGNKKITVTNTFTKPEETTDITITKIWIDNDNEAEKRPESVILQVKNGDTVAEEQTVTSENAVRNEVNHWQYTFIGLEKYDEDGQEIKYTADEKETNSGDLQFYEKAVDGTTVTNTFTQKTDKVSVTATKIWEDTELQKAKRPQSIILQLKHNGTVVASKEAKMNTEEDEFTITFEDLPKYDKYNNIINYTIDEVEKNTGDLRFYVKTITGMTITNTFTRPTDTISIEVKKEWVDQTDIYDKRPDTIALQLKNGEKLVEERIITKEDNWSWKFEKLPMYDENGEIINYTVDEKEVREGDLFYYTKQIGKVSIKPRQSITGTSVEMQATITNTLSKIPSFVEVKYVDIRTKEEIDDTVEKEGIVGESFDVTEDKKEIPGYTLVQEPSEKTGVFTEEKQVKTYYYAKNTEVIVKYLEKGTGKILTEEPQYEIKGWEGQSYTTQRKEIAGYTFIESTGKTSGVMERETIEVIYYYAPNTKIIVKYLEKDDTPEDDTDNEVLSPEETIDGYVGKEYQTQKRELTGYTFVESTNNTSGTMEKEVIEVIYYYLKNTQVVVRYLEKDDTPENNQDNQVLADEIIINGCVGQSYRTEAKTIKDYVFVESTNNTSGNMTKEVIEVIYYYAKVAKATVQHIDRETGKILKQETKVGEVGDLFETQSEDFPGYILVIEPENPDVIMTEEEQIIKYYYAKISGGVIEKHINEITKELLDSKQYKGNEGDPYKIESKEFEGYDLVTEDKNGNSRLPENAEGTMKEELIEVKYYYIKKASVRVEHIDQETGEKLTEDEIQNGHENDNYTTEKKDFKGYTLVEKPKNATGKMTITQNEDGTYKTETVVTYYYVKQAGGVVEKHIDMDTNKVLAQETHKGNIGEEYNILARKFDGYELVTKDENGNNKLPQNSKGEMKAEKIEVVYYYRRLAKVTVEYIDKHTGRLLDKDEIQGKIGETYETQEKQFDGYELVEVPSNGKGEMKEKEIVVKYYYQRKAEVEIRYLEKDTNYPLAENENIKGYLGDRYKTEQKEIAYYKFVESTANTSGNMTENKIIVTYYYQKQIFNLSVDKWISKVNMDGISAGARDFATKDQLYKLDVHSSKAGTADIKLKYTIRVTNNGEIEGTAERITELIPIGYRFHQEDNEIHWEEVDGTLTTDVLKGENIQPGQYKEIPIVLRWNTGEENFGQKNNTVIISNLSNPAKYQDTNKEDNTSKSEMLLTVATGLDRNGRIIAKGIVEIVIVISVGLWISYKKKDR